MTDKPSCEPCTNVNRSRLKLCANTNYYCTVISDFISYDDESMIKKVGCLSHSQAREYLMEPVLEELERSQISESKTAMTLMDKGLNGDIHIGGEEAIAYAIKLIKNGVDGKCGEGQTRLNKERAAIRNATLDEVKAEMDLKYFFFDREKFDLIFQSLRKGEQ